MVGWMVTVSVIRNVDEIGHEMYAVAIEDPTQAIDTVLRVANGEAAVLNCKIDEASIEALALKVGDALKILDEKTDPRASRLKRH
jgi:CxxC motif-containing protein